MLFEKIFYTKDWSLHLYTYRSIHTGKKIFFSKVYLYQKIPYEAKAKLNTENYIFSPQDPNRIAG